MCDIDRLHKLFWQLHHEDPLIVRAPGRINLIGEHTDYNDGFVLPAAIDKAVYVAINKRSDNKIYLHAEEYNENYIADIENLRQSKFHWSSYLLGVTDQLLKKKFSVTGFNIVVDGDVPVGAGMAASAAIECATVFALNKLFELNIGKLDMVKIAQKAEQEFVGLQCGVMDMFSSMFGKKDHVVKLDCKTMDYEYVPLKLEGYKILLLNTNVKHSLSSSEYNVRREQCEKGVAIVKEHHPEVNSLRDVTMEMLDKYVASAEPLIYQRCKYVVEEKQRLLEGCEDLKNGHVEALGKKLFQTHDGLSKLYEVSCPELDFLVDAVRENNAVLGARMMGGGFGGCTINIVKEESIEPLVAELIQSYKAAMNLDLTAYVVAIENGTSLLESGN